MSQFFSKLKSAFSHSSESANDSPQPTAQSSAVSVNPDWIENYFAGDFGLAAGAMEMFLEDTVPEFEKLNKVFEKEGMEALGKQLHRIKPSFKIIGLDEFSDTLGKLEKDCVDAVDANIIEKKLKQLTTDFYQLLPIIKEQYSNISKLAEL